ncbi:MAG: hypothetical protein WCO09_00790 [bacterium]
MTIKQNKTILSILFIVFIVFIFKSASFFTKTTTAQTSGDLFGDNNFTPIPAQIKEIKEQLDITVSPEVPKPGEDITINVESYGLDLNSTNIQWMINGKEKLKGAGAKTFKFNVGNSGESRVILNISPKDQPQIVRFFIFNPSNVDLLWEAETYTPPFYKGKALLTTEASATMVAIPNFIDGNSRVNDSNVVYKWSIDREVQGDYSGYGKNYFKYTTDVLPIDKEIEVEAYPAGQDTRKGVGTTQLTTLNPFVLFYEDNPVNGVMFNYSLVDQIDLGSRTESKVSVFPYNFSTTDKNSNLDYSWYINSEKIDVPLTTNSITIKRNANKIANEANITVGVENPTHMMQSTQSVLDFIFNNK